MCDYVKASATLFSVIYNPTYKLWKFDNRTVPGACSTLDKVAQIISSGEKVSFDQLMRFWGISFVNTQFINSLVATM